MPAETLEQMMHRVWLDCIEASKHPRPDWILVNGELYEAVSASLDKPDVCSPAGLASLFPAWGANIRRKSGSA